MKYSIFTLIISIMISNVQAQTVYYLEGSKGKVKNERYQWENIDIEFAKEGGINNSTQQSDLVGNQSDGSEVAPVAAAAISAVVPAAINAGFRLADSIIAKNVRKYEAEYPHYTSYLEAGTHHIPDFTFSRTVYLTDGERTALRFFIKARKVLLGEDVGMVYCIDSIQLNCSSAKIKGVCWLKRVLRTKAQPDKSLSYIISITPTFLVTKKQGENIVKEKIPLTFKPIKINSVQFGNETDCTNERYRTDIQLVPADAFMTELTINIVETNPRKISIEKIESNWKAYRDDLKTSIDDFSNEQIKILQAIVKKQEEEKEKEKNAIKSNDPAQSTGTTLGGS